MIDHTPCSDSPCVFCSLTRRQYDELLLASYFPPEPTLRTRIWSKFTTLAQWVRPGKN